MEQIVRPSAGGRGFTLMETALAIVIVGVGFLSVFELYTNTSRQNFESASVTTAAALAGNVREMMQGLRFDDPVDRLRRFGAESGEDVGDFDDVDDFDGVSLNPPLDSTRQPLEALSQYTQVVSVMPVDANRPSMNTNEAAPTIPKTAYTGAVRVRVRILYAASPAEPQREVYRAQWLRMDR
jgi:prepilin-type N-terminal cleavage/methylation domain-containing protein